MRPDLRIEPAFLELVQAVLRHGRRPAGQGRLRRDRRRPAAADRGLPRQGRRARAPSPRPTARHEDLQIRATHDPRPGAGVPRGARPCGCATRSSDARVRELDALVLAAAGSSRPARQPGRRPAGPAVGRPPQAAGRPRRSPRPLPRPPARPCARSAPRAAATSRSARCSWRPGFLPDRAAELALEAGAVAVSEPLGADPEVARTILARYAVGAVELVPV